MGQWLYDPRESQAAGEARFRLPYPQGNWRKERAWNAFLLEAMGIAWTALMVFSRPAEQWEKAENQFYL